MDTDCESSHANSNVLFLSDFLTHRDGSSGHRCGFSCEVEHVWANLYRCKSSGTSHVCDKNCDQRTLYDNHSTICRASGVVLPLAITEGRPVQGVRRNQDWEDYLSHSSKRSRSSSFQMVSSICGQLQWEQSDMELN